MLAKALQGGTSAAKTYVDDVFSTYLYTGDGSNGSAINNGIDLAGKGGMVWLKSRSSTDIHGIYDTARGAGSYLNSSSTSAQATAQGVGSFTSTGFTINNALAFNTNDVIYTSWTFRKAAKFFDVVTYTGDGTDNRQISHALGVTPGMIVVKRTDVAGSWRVVHRGNGTNWQGCVLNTTAAAVSPPDSGLWGTGSSFVAPTATNFTVGNSADGNANGGTYVAYLFAHDTAADGLIQCGSFTNGAEVNVGWEPQWLLMKRTDSNSSWFVLDSMRGMVVGGNEWSLSANATDAEGTSNIITPTATGFLNPVFTTGTYIYIAIRRPNKPPTSGTQVFQPTVYTGTNVNNRLVNTTIAPDMVWVRQRDDTVLGGMVVGDRLRGQPYLLTGTTAAEVTSTTAFDQQIVSATEYGTAFSAMDGFWVGKDTISKVNANTTSNNHIAEAFKRAPGFFDVVCYTGTSANRAVDHGLGAVPELMIVKRRDLTSSPSWGVYAAPLGNTNFVSLTNNALSQAGSTYWNNTSPTSTTFTLGTNTNVNASGGTYVAYLFASLPGISKVGSYTGNGGTQTINCGFTAGARFVLIKQTSGTGGNWNVWDTARGIVAAADPYLLLNTTGAEVTGFDVIDPDNSGFALLNNSFNTLNETYIYLAIA